MTKYAELERICDVLFGIFTIVWIITRLGVYPVYILNRYEMEKILLIHILFEKAQITGLIFNLNSILSSTLIEAPKIVPMFAAYYIFNSMLTILLCLHGFWTYFICKVAFKALSTGKVEKDERSSSETMSDLETTSDEMEIKDKLKDEPFAHHINNKKIS